MDAAGVDAAGMDAAGVDAAGMDAAGVGAAAGRDRDSAAWLRAVGRSRGRVGSLRGGGSWQRLKKGGMPRRNSSSSSYMSGLSLSRAGPLAGVPDFKKS
jgi:hypothetical protein